MLMMMNFPKLAYIHFKLQDFKINNESVNFGTVSPYASLVMPGDLATDIYPKPGCDIHEPCKVDYCQNDGRCVDLWTEKICECPIGFTGNHCQNQDIAEFTAKSFLHFAGQQEISDIQFKISIQEPSGLLLYTVSSCLD